MAASGGRRNTNSSMSVAEIIMISATLIELLVLRRPPVAAMACLSAHTYVAWGRLLHRPASADSVAPPRLEIVRAAAPVEPVGGEAQPPVDDHLPVSADQPPLVNDHLALHEGMNVAAIRVRAGGVEGPRD